MQKETFEVEYEYEGERLDKYVSILFPEQSRSFFQKLIKDGNVSVNDKIQKANYRLKTEDLVTVEIPDAVETQILPEDIPLDILYEDDDLLVVNKPKGIGYSLQMTLHRSAQYLQANLHHDGKRLEEKAERSIGMTEECCRTNTLISHLLRIINRQRVRIHHISIIRVKGIGSFTTPMQQFQLV